MGKILTKTIEQTVYVSNDGKETVLTEMNDAHLVNAFGHACKKSLPEGALSWTRTSNTEHELLSKALRAEILRRLAICKSSNDQ